MHTVRLYVDGKDKLLIVLSEFTIPQAVIYQLSLEILSFIRKNGMSRIISIGGMPSQKQSEVPYIISSDPEITKKAAKQGIKPITEGVIAGVSALLVMGANELKIPTVNLLVEVNPLIMDPKYAETAIEGLNKITGLKIDLSELEKEAKEVESRVRDIMKKAKDSHEHASSPAEDMSGPPSYA
jgi:predicted ATP-grasp superfamily ATP-dependent carboligase